MIEDIKTFFFKYSTIIFMFILAGYFFYQIYRIERNLAALQTTIEAILTGDLPQAKASDGKMIRIVPSLVNTINALDARITKLEAKK